MRRLKDLQGEFERAVFLAAYHSLQQRRRRHWALLGLVAKHGLRGLAFSWPAYVLALAAVYSDTSHALAYLAVLLLAVGVSGMILIRGVRDDYRTRVQGRLREKTGHSGV